ncbi:hypothetical protein [Nostoc phage N1]|nr:hypothetical protein [Nostoc phage N1]
MRETYTYDGFTGTKKEWSDRIGISYGAMIERFKKHYPDRLEKVFSTVYLTPGANMTNETCKEARSRVKKSLKHQYQYMGQLAVKKHLKEQLKVVEVETQDNLKGWSEL